MTVRILAVALLATSLSGCALLSRDRPPIPLASAVDLQRFMGDWYVIAFIPIFPEKNAHNGIESYALNPDGTIATTYRFRDGAFDGPIKVNYPLGFVRENTNNALWGMQFLWIRQRSQLSGRFAGCNMINLAPEGPAPPTVSSF